MRISTSQIFQTGARNLMDGQSSLYKTQNQLSSGKKFLSAQDDPVAAAQVVLAKQTLAINEQHADNQSTASSQLAYEESRLHAVVNSVQNIMERVVAGGNPSYSDSERQFIAQDLQSELDFLFGTANTIDANGYYLFSGYQGSTKPFQQLANGSVQYAGDDGQRLMQVGASRQIAVSDSGRDVFERNRTGNGTFSLAAASTNTGTGIAVPGSVLNPSAWTGHGYSISFTTTATSTTYIVTDTTTGTAVPPPPAVPDQNYVSGAEITLVPGISFSISGAPATNDTFTVAPSTNQSVFTTLRNLISAFSTPVSGNVTATAALRNTINTEMANLDGVLDNVLTVQASIGSRMKEVESLSSVSESLELQYKERLSNLQDVDYAEAISRFAAQQTQLEAAQASFAKVSGLSLFNYL